MWAFEEARKQHLANIHEMIRGCGLSPEDLAANKALQSKAKKPAAKQVGKKRKPSISDEDEEASDDTQPPLKKTHADEERRNYSETGLRRSQRNQGKKIDYSQEDIAGSRRTAQLPSVQAGLRKSEPRSVDKRKHDPLVCCTLRAFQSK